MNKYQTLNYLKNKNKVSKILIIKQWNLNCFKVCSCFKNASYCKII